MEHQGMHCQTKCVDDFKTELNDGETISDGYFNSERWTDLLKKN